MQHILIISVVLLIYSSCGLIDLVQTMFRPLMLVLRKIIVTIKNKFGIGVQGVCSTNRRFLDDIVVCLGSTLDYLALVAINFHTTLKDKGFIS